MLHRVLPPWIWVPPFDLLVSRQTFKANDNKNIRPVSERKKNGIVPKVLGNFQVENVLTICNSSPPFWNDDQVEYVLISFSKLFCFSNKWQMASANVTFFFFFAYQGFLLTIWANLWLNAFIVKIVNSRSILSAWGLNFMFPVMFSVSLFFGNIDVFTHNFQIKAPILTRNNKSLR